MLPGVVGDYHPLFQLVRGYFFFVGDVRVGWHLLEAYRHHVVVVTVIDKSFTRILQT